MYLHTNPSSSYHLHISHFLQLDCGNQSKAWDFSGYIVFHVNKLLFSQEWSVRLFGRITFEPLSRMFKILYLLPRYSSPTIFSHLRHFIVSSIVHVINNKQDLTEERPCYWLSQKTESSCRNLIPHEMCIRDSPLLIHN